MNNKLKIIIFIISIIPLITWSFSYSDIYEYVDENGISHFTNIPKNKNFKKIIISGRNSLKNKSIIPSDYHQIILSKARRYNIEPSLIKAIITVESNWNPVAISRRGAIGLMQLMPSTIKEMQVNNPFNPEENIEGGVRYLRLLLDRFKGELPLALAAYNAGPEVVEKFGDVPPIQETRQFVQEVLSMYKSNLRNQRSIIYKIIYNDGTILYTNNPLSYINSPSSLSEGEFFVILKMHTSN